MHLIRYGKYTASVLRDCGAIVLQSHYEIHFKNALPTSCVNSSQDII